MTDRDHIEAAHAASEISDDDLAPDPSWETLALRIALFICLCAVGAMVLA